MACCKADRRRNSGSISRLSNAAAGHFGQIPAGRRNGFHLEQTGAWKGNQPALHKVPCREASCVNHGDPDWSENALAPDDCKVGYPFSSLPTIWAAGNFSLLNLRVVKTALDCGNWN